MKTKALTLLAILSLSFGFYSCSSDDDNNSEENLVKQQITTTNNLLQGVWQYEDKNSDHPNREEFIKSEASYYSGTRVFYNWSDSLNQYVSKDAGSYGIRKQKDYEYLVIDLDVVGNMYSNNPLGVQDGYSVINITENSFKIGLRNKGTYQYFTLTKVK